MVCILMMFKSDYITFSTSLLLCMAYRRRNYRRSYNRRSYRKSFYRRGGHYRAA